MLVSIFPIFWTLSYTQSSQVYAESWLLRSQLKTDIRVQVRNLRSLFPESLDESPEELQTQVRDTVQKWVGDGSYLHATGSNPVWCSTLASHLPLTSLQDEQIHFAHPIIASTAKSFYFDKWHAISTCDRETFNGSVPKPLIALIGTVVCFLCHTTPHFCANNHSVQKRIRRVVQWPSFDCKARHQGLQTSVRWNPRCNGPRREQPDGRTLSSGTPHRVGWIRNVWDALFLFSLTNNPAQVHECSGTYNVATFDHHCPQIEHPKIVLLLCLPRPTRSIRSARSIRSTRYPVQCLALTRLSPTLSFRLPPI